MSPFIIGVAGGSGSGKSTVTEQILASIGANSVAVILQDNYYLDRSYLSMLDREQNVNYDHPDAFDWALMKEQISCLESGGTIDMPNYDFLTHTRKTSITKIAPAKIIIMEGIYALYDFELSKKMSLRIFVDTASDIRLMRRLKRDISERGSSLENTLYQYSRYVRPMYKEFVEPTKRRAHIIIPHGSNQAALEMVVSRINSVLNNQQIKVEKDKLFKTDDISDMIVW